MYEAKNSKYVLMEARLMHLYTWLEKVKLTNNRVSSGSTLFATLNTLLVKW